MYLIIYVFIFVLFPHTDLFLYFFLHKFLLKQTLSF